MASSGVLLFDPPRKIRQSTMSYDFWGKKPVREKRKDWMTFSASETYYREFFSGGLATPKPAAGADESFQKSVRSCCIKRVCDITLDDESRVCAELGKTLDEIEESLALDHMVGARLKPWRKYFGKWRRALFHQAQDVAYRLALLQADPTSDRFQVEKHGDLKAEVDAVKTRLDSAFTAVMSTMSIAESERAISEAVVVTRLTHLALFFIPLSLISSIFGMNIVVSEAQWLFVGISNLTRQQDWENKLTTAAWVGASLLSVAVTYGMLYRTRVAGFVFSVPRRVQALDRQRVRTLLVRGVKMVGYFFATIYVIGFWAGIGVGIWKLADSELPRETKIAVGVGAIGIPLVVVPLLLLFFCCCTTVAIAVGPSPD